MGEHPSEKSGGCFLYWAGRLIQEHCEGRGGGVNPFRSLLKPGNWDEMRGLFPGFKGERQVSSTATLPLCREALE
ncbi:hypothetical protein [Paenibacillus sp. GM2FR]|uniref:hypothetical protein n=1 Tax=Paenibacillus sp. GM2FR TaxID=2059268 RepID=UPI001055B51B|nr:hypothetical protein [Paenibacillus sp. GM2FR]